MERKEDFDSLSESDASSGIDYALEKLPSRNGVMRVQPMKLSCRLEECVPMVKQELHHQMMKFSFGQRKSPTIRDIGGGVTEGCKIPYELFQTSTVYVDVESMKTERELHPFLPRLPYNLIAKLQRLPSPYEKADALSKAETASSKAMRKGKENPGDKKTSSSAAANAPNPKSSMSKGGPPSKRDAGSAPDTQTATDKRDLLEESLNACCYVRVVVIDRKAGLTDEHWQEAADCLLSEQPLMRGSIIS